MQYEPLPGSAPRAAFSRRQLLTAAAVMVLVGCVALFGVESDEPTSAVQFSEEGNTPHDVTDIEDSKHPAKKGHISKEEKAREERKDLKKDKPLHKLDDDLKEAHRFFHISDTHIDPFFSPAESMAPGQCHSCQFDDSVQGDQVFCPTQIPRTEAGKVHLQNAGYAFGRYGCNPPHRLLHSLLEHLKAQEENPPFIIFTGDIAPHGYPGDRYKLDEHTKLEDICPTKLAIMREHVKEFHDYFPNTKFAFAMGNNDHLPKNTFWKPWIQALGDMFHEEGWFDDKQHKDFTAHGSHYVDAEGVRFLCIDFTLFTPGGETSFYDKDKVKDMDPAEAFKAKFPIREKAIEWIAEALKDADKQGLSIHLVGHQPLTTKKGKDELDVEGLHYGRLKNLLEEYKHIIKMGYFGHRNLAGLQEVLSPLHYPLVPSLTAPGVSPRGKNQPSYNTIFMDKKTHVVLEFEQWTFNLMDENRKAMHEGVDYLGEWKQHANDVYSWRAISGHKEFTPQTLQAALESIPKDSKLFFAIEVWKRAGYIGDETPENYYCKSLFDSNDGQMRCLFPLQDKACWNPGWLS